MIDYEKGMNKVKAAKAVVSMFSRALLVALEAEKSAKRADD